MALRTAKLRRDFDAAHRLAHEAQVREALTRTELTLALGESLAERAEMARRVREHALAAYAARGGAIKLRRHNRISQVLDKMLVRLGSVGQALVIARSGVWRRTTRPLFDLRHMAAYARRGPDPSVSPPALFDQAWRLAHSPDLAASRMAPLVHYLVAGFREHRDPHPLFAEAWYARQNAYELAATSLSGLEHYVRAGAARGSSPHPLFDVAHYLAQGPALAHGEDPLSHYLREGGRLGLSPHPLFDPAWYAEQAPEAAGSPSLVHYLEAGSPAGLSPHPLFEPAWYAKTYPQVAESGLEPLVHYVTIGAFEHRAPSPWFDVVHYLATRAEGLPPGANPLIDYLQGGAWAGSEARPGFPTSAYLAARPDLVRAGLTPLEHWARRRGR
ncbi:hypothetical protein [uncultured Phenylobacterium sp.]|uniref:hypothetical protein n=1 Tax=uncultured Phenylobacterium sp. TaxID=349273 RepID=UPI002600DF5D|nr:hypothetical protein [uncultured Phenylobacterium sp.]